MCVKVGVVIVFVGEYVPFAVCVCGADCSAGGFTQEGSVVDLSDDAFGRMPLRCENNNHTYISVDVLVSLLAESVETILDLLRSQIQEIWVGQ